MKIHVVGGLKGKIGGDLEHLKLVDSLGPEAPIPAVAVATGAALGNW